MLGDTRTKRTNGITASDVNQNYDHIQLAFFKALLLTFSRIMSNRSPNKMIKTLPKALRIQAVSVSKFYFQDKENGVAE